MNGGTRASMGSVAETVTGLLVGAAIAAVVVYALLRRFW